MFATSLPEEKLIEMYRKLWLARNHELLAEEWKLNGRIQGSVHLATGQEAVAVGACSALEVDDYIMGTHREHAQMIAKGVNIRRMAAEMLGKATGMNQGKAGHMLFSDKSVNALGGCGIVGGGTAVAVGYAMAFKVLGTRQVSLVFFGDGAFNTGAVHEAINFASVRKYPVIFLCENNRWGLTVMQHEQTVVEDLSDRARCYGIPGVTVNGNDVLAVYEAVKLAVDRAREGDGPSVIEAKTWRMRGLAAGYPMDWEPSEYHEEGRKQDPIRLFEEKLIARNILSEEMAKGIEEETRRVVEEAYEEASQAPYPDEAVFWENVFAAPIG
ncbi:MAG: thiamine pyrophosphate-dependent dehydrogenase E1 component subunit alpha [Synergistales bacterium]|jgi:TPP-dependent pyruvate/acetoin dehydrogenase alpha subunit